MCSIILKVLFLGGLAGGVALTCVALATSYWRQGNEVVSWHQGLWTACVKNPLAQKSDLVCGKDSFGKLSAGTKAVIILMAIVLFISLFAFGWWALACIGCCCQNFLTPPLPMLALLLLLLDLAAVITYASTYQDPGSGKYGYSFWCAVAAVCSFGITVFLGFGIVSLNKQGRDRTAYRSI